MERNFNMCAVSMIMDNQYDNWRYRFPQPVIPMAPQQPYYPPSVPSAIPTPNIPTAQEIEEFRKLLERAREYDKKHNEPDCEMEEKRQKLLDLADALGIKIDFV